MAVPWSSLILLGEILLCCVAFLPSVASALGLGLQWIICALNDYIDRINSLPFSVWGPLQISTFQLMLMFMIITMLSMYLMQKKRKAVVPALLCLLLFVGMRSYAFIEASFQKKIIVYNIPNMKAIDFVSGRTIVFIGDAALSSNKQMAHLYLQPARSFYHLVTEEQDIHRQDSNSVIQFYNRLVLIGGPSINIPSHPFPIDLLILSKDVRIDLPYYIYNTHPKLIVADASNHHSKRNEWRRICNTLRIPFHDVTTDGALQYDLN
jgi:competence protein ComEC